MDKSAIDSLLTPYNPWWDKAAGWTVDLPDYQRPVVHDVLADLRELPQIVSITGPRRVGKSTAVWHVIQHLVERDATDPRRIVYYSFDDPALIADESLQRTIFDALIERFKPLGRPLYFFLDEIQRFPRWELHLKKAYDLKQPVRFVISGSASSPIFRSSQETLLGRIKDRHLLPFSFREYCAFQLRKDPAFARALGGQQPIRPALLAGDGRAAAQQVSEWARAMAPFANTIDRAVIDYCIDGGFPEVWSLPDAIRKIEYLMEQQVRKVLYEDLMMLTTYRKPENVLRFFVYLLAHPGVEINTARVSADIGVERRVIDENLPRLELTDLVMRIQRFSAQPRRVRKGNIKCYPVDLALRNAVLKTWGLPDPTTMGLYAENLVLRELMAWPERIEASYYREKDREVDFVLTFGGDQHLPIEVRSHGDPRRLETLRMFVSKYGSPLGLVITRDRDVRFDEFVYLPLRYFLLAT